jgi:NAD(P)-dependent dehydrogenase (short-subunit alcohol dehydrogenase family)
MTKGGVTLFTKSAALEFARKGYRIRVNSMHPGTIDTDMGDQVLATRARNLGTNDIEMARRQVIERLPIGRMGTPTDIAKGIVFPRLGRCRLHDRRRPRHRRRHHRAVEGRLLPHSRIGLGDFEKLVIERERRAHDRSFGSAEHGYFTI